MAGTASISGVVSGLDTSEIIAKIMQLESVPVQRMQARKTALTNKLAAWQEMNTRILALKIKAGTLANPSTFQAKTITSSDSSILTGTASSTAQTGTYYLKVTQVAKSHMLMSAGFDDTDTTQIGTGTIQIKIGDGEFETVTIDSSNNTLAGIRDAINEADVGATASIINDGSADPYKLILTSDTSGSAGGITVGGTLDLDIETELRPAHDAIVTMGDEPNQVVITKSTNTISDFIPGVTLNVQSADVSETVTITVANNTASVKQNITDFVTQYNNLVDFFNTQATYIAETNTTGTLFGDTYLRMIQSDLVSRVSNPVTGLSQTIKVLSQIGITSSTNGKLSINQTELDAAIANDSNSVRRLFGTVGEASNSNVTYISSTAMTQPSSVSGYDVAITQLATQARVTAGATQTQNLAADETLTINNVEILLTAGMDQAAVIEKINDYTNETGVVASATLADGTGTGNYLTLKRAAYGSSYTVAAVSSLAAGEGNDTSGIGNLLVTPIGPGAGTGAVGVDVAGTIDGEAATGNGQFLTGDTDNEHTEGLKIKFNGTTTGSFGTVNFTRGVGGLSSDYLSQITDATSGAVTSAQDSLENQIQGIDDDIAEMGTRLAARETRLMAQFAAMESALARLQSQSTFLSGQILQMQNNWMNS